jgi:primosomal protein N' (replication factor Y)
MRIIHAIPLSRGVFRDSLSYFASIEINPGAIVSVPIRSKEIPALVVSSQLVDDVKAAIRGADYPVKKIKNLRARGLVRPEFIAAAEEAANYFGSPLGPTIRSLLPKAILEMSDDLDSGELKAAPPRPEYPFGGNTSTLQDTDEERLGFYKSLIRETFAHNGSVFLCLPTAQDLEPVLSRLERGISEYTFIFHNGLSKKELANRWKKALALNHPILVVATPPFLSLPRQDIRVIIMDREQVGSYKQMSRPLLDLRVFIEILSHHYQTKLIIGDSSLRTETMYRAEAKLLGAGSPLKQRAPSHAKPQLVKGRTALALEEEMRQLLVTAVENDERTLVIANRRGLAPLVVCNDCGTTVVCERCESPMALHRANNTDEPDDATKLVCHRCGSRRSAKETCAVCNSWRLQELGTGIEKVLRELSELFPDTPLLRLDSDSVKTATQAREVIKKYFATPGAILVATEMVLYYLQEPVENILVVAVDSMLALPDFRTHERLFGLLIRFRALALKNFAIATRHVTEPLFEYALRGNIIGFYREEIANRQNFGYPPFKLLVKISREGGRELVREDMKKLEGLLKKYEPAVYPSFVFQVENRYRLNLLLKLDPTTWPDLELSAVLKSLPPSFIVNVEPADIL